MSINQLHCPLCARPLGYLEQFGQLLTYRCTSHGVMVYPPDGRFRAETPEEIAERLHRLPLEASGRKSSKAVGS
jgi:hypothetical protein